MADIFTKEKRSAIMGRIQGKDTKPEIVGRSLLHKSGYRFRLHKTSLPGKPDIVLPKYKTVIFIHGCYWHRHTGCKRGQSVPSTNTAFWKNKFAGTIERDKESIKQLEKLGWQIATIWECETKDIEKLKRRLVSTLKKPKNGDKTKK